MCVYETADELDNRSFVRKRERKGERERERIRRRPACYVDARFVQLLFFLFSRSLFLSLSSLYSEYMKQANRKRKNASGMCQ